MGFSKVFYGGGGRPSPVHSGDPAQGVLYGITPQGQLLWYQDVNRHGRNGPNAETGWAPRSGTPVGCDWHHFKHVVSGGDGIIYAITGDGRLLWYRDADRQGNNGPCGERGWAPGSGNQIGCGWNDFKHVFSDGTGIIYAVTGDGRLLWYRDDDRQGNNGPCGERGWAPGSGNQIHFGWYRFIHVCASGGNIYAVTGDGRLLWYRDVDRQGGNDPGGLQGWAPGSGSQIGIGWNQFSHLIGGGVQSGSIGDEGGTILYAITPDGGLRWYRDAIQSGTNAPDGSTGWSAGSGSQIGVGW